MSYEEDKTNFAMWCMLAAPLVLGNDLTAIDEETLEIITNEELIAIDQDPAVIMAQVVREDSGVQTWVKPLGSEDSDVKAVALLNRNNYEVAVTVDWSELGFTGDVEVRDLWAHEDLTVTSKYNVTLPAHGTAVFKVMGETDVSAAVLKATVSEYSSVDTAEGELDWVSGNNSKENAYVIVSADEASANVSAVTTQRVAKFYISANGTATVTATLDGKQTTEAFTGARLYTVTYCGELGGPDLTVTVDGGVIDAITVANAPDTSAEPEQDILAIANSAADSSEIDTSEGTIDYMAFDCETGDISENKSGILTDYVTACGAEHVSAQTSPYDYFELILPAAAEAARANIYYNLSDAGVSVSVEKEGECKTVAVSNVSGGQDNVLSIVYTSAEEVRITLTVTAVYSENSGLSLHGVTLGNYTENAVMDYPTVTEESGVLNIVAETYLLSGSADDTLNATVVDAEGNTVAESSETVTIGGKVAVSVNLPDDFTAGTLNLGLINANIYYDFELPLDKGLVFEQPEHIGTLAAKELVEGGAVLLDVRSAEEYEAGHVDGAVNVLYTQVLYNAEELIPDKATPIVVYCSAGKRSAQAQMALLALGYESVSNLGAMENWYIEPSITIGGADTGVELDETIPLYSIVNPFEKDLELLYAIGADAAIDDAVTVPASNTVSASGDGVVKAWLLWKGEVVSTAERELPLLINLPIPTVNIDVYMTDLTWTTNTCYWSSNKINLSNSGNTITIAGNTFAHGIGSHAASVIAASIPEGMTRFVAVAGADGEVETSAISNKCKIQFAVYIDDVLMEQSLELPYGYYHVFDIAIPEGAEAIRLETYPTSDGTAYDHADWGIAGFTDGIDDDVTEDDTPEYDTPEDAVEIGSAEELIALMNDSSMWAGDYKLTADIDLTDVDGQAPIGNTTTTFTGTFNGQGYSIKGLNLTNLTVSRVGLFGCIEGDAIVKDLTVYGEVSTSGIAVGGIVGIVQKNAVVVNCVNYCNVSSSAASDSMVGGIAGTLRSNSASSNAKIINCKNYGAVTGNQHVGGIAGQVSVFSGGETGTTLTVSGCANYGTVNATASSSRYHGGITGYITARAESQVTVENCLNAGDVTGGRDVGGIVGWVTPVVTNSIVTNNLMNSGDVYAETGYVGGFFGYHHASYNGNATLNNSFYSSGTVSAGSSANASYVKPIAGVPRGSVFTNAYYLECGITDSKGTAITKDESILASTFENFDSKYWIVDKYGPELLFFHTHELETVTAGTDGHYGVCYCGYVTDIEPHVDEIKDNMCDDCGEALECKHVYVLRADGMYYCANGCGLVDTVPEAPVVVSAISEKATTKEVVVTVSVKAATPIVAHSFRVDAPEGFILKRVENLIEDADADTSGWSFVGSDNITSPYDSVVIRMDMADSTIDCAVAKYVFTAEEATVNETYIFTVEALETYNYADEAIEAVSVNAEATVVQEEEVILGDVNGDNIISVADVLMILRAVLRGAQLENADMNEDNTLNLIDVLRALKQVVSK